MFRMSFSNVHGHSGHLAVGVLFTLVCFVHLTSSYSSHISLGNGVCNVSWSVVNKTIAFSVTARSTGWVALSLNTDKTNVQADVYLAYYYRNRTVLKDCTIPKEPGNHHHHHIMQDGNSHKNVYFLQTKNIKPGIITVLFHRKTNTRDVQDITIKPGMIYMQCATGQHKPKSRGNIQTFLNKITVEDLVWTNPVGVSLIPKPKKASKKHKTTKQHKNDSIPTKGYHTPGSLTNLTDVSESRVKDKFYDFQPLLVLLTVSGLITSIIVMVVYCKCASKRSRTKSNMSVAFYKGSNNSWSDVSDEDDERMAFINNNNKSL